MVSMSNSHPSPKAPSRNPWLWLSLAALFLLISNGRHAVSTATWVSLLFILHFVRLEAKRIGLPLAWLVLFLAWAFQFRGMAPLPGIFYFLLSAAYAFMQLLPMWIDRLLIFRLTGFRATLLFPSAWVTMEWIVATFTPYGSWSSLAYTQHENMQLLQILAVTGLYGVSFLIAWFASVGSWVLIQEWGQRSARKGALIFAVVLILVLLGGGMRLVLFPPNAPTVRIASLSKSDQDLFAGVKEDYESILAGKVSPEGIDRIRSNGREIMDDLFLRSDKECQAGAKIIFWGEANGFSFKEDEPVLLARGAQFAREREIYLGMALAIFDPTRDKPLENEIILMTPKGEQAFEYHKAIPVPGGEAQIQAPGDGIIRTADSPYGRLGTAICFDMDFPGLLKQAGRRDADILLVPANDWREIDPWHSHMARFRAIEHGFNMVRHASNGLSLASDYEGRVLAAMDHFVTSQRSLVAYVPTKGVRTIYSRIGDTFSWICIVSLGIFVFTGFRRRPQRDASAAEHRR
jgi:apolipoprotein N-acyltransferase